MTSATVSRRAQLVPGVADEVTLARERSLEAVEHPVEGVAELGDLIVALDGDAAREVGLGDRPRGVAEPTQRREHPPRSEVGEHRREHQHADPHPPGDLHRLADLILLALQEVGDHEGSYGPIGRLEGRGDVARRPRRRVRGSAHAAVELAPFGEQARVRLQRVTRALSARDPVGPPVDEGDQRLALARDVACEVDVEDAPHVCPEGLAGQRVAAPGQAAELRALLDERLVDAVVEANEQDLADGSDRRESREGEQDQV